MKPIVLALVYGTCPGLIRDMIDLRNTLVARPYPTGECIIQVLSRKFPQATQKQLFELTETIKEDIAEHESFCKVANQNKHAN